MRDRSQKIIESLVLSSIFFDSGPLTLDQEKEVKVYAPMLYRKDPIITRLIDEIAWREAKRSFLNAVLFLGLTLYLVFCVLAPFALTRLDLESRIGSLGKAFIPDVLLSLGVVWQVILHCITLSLFFRAKNRIRHRYPSYYLRNDLEDHVVQLYNKGGISSKGMLSGKYKVAYSLQGKLPHHCYRILEEYDHPCIGEDDMRRFVPPLYPADKVLAEAIDSISKERIKGDMKKAAWSYLPIHYGVVFIVFPILVATGLAPSFTEKLSGAFQVLSLGFGESLVNLRWYWLTAMHVTVAFVLFFIFPLDFRTSAESEAKKKLDAHVSLLFDDDSIGFREEYTFHGFSPDDCVNEESYDIAVSYAGEDRAFASEIARDLEGRGIRVFYDEFEQENLWGKDLAVHLHKVYSRQARYCMILVSKFYAEKAWTTHELRAALERAVEAKGGEYILPVRLDDSALPGLPTTLGFLKAQLGVAHICSLVEKKLRAV